MNEIDKLKQKINKNDYSIDILLEIYDNIKNKNQKDFIKLKAEICYLIAMHYKDTNRKKAKKFALSSINYYNKLNITTLEDSVPILYEKLPSYMHENVVKERLEDILK